MVLLSCGGGQAEGPSDAVQASSPSGPTSVLDGRLIAGYQGWYGCPGDFEGNTGWYHWFVGQADLANLAVDMLPDVSQLPASSLCDTGLKLPGGQTLKLYSSLDPALVDHHFAQMASHGVGAVALQRFISDISTAYRKRRVDRVLENALQAARRHKLPLYITYDVSGAVPATVMQAVREDWADLNGRYSLSADSGYLRNSRLPVVQLWGFGFLDHPGEPEEVRRLLTDLKQGSGLPASFVIGGVPWGWSSLSRDAKSAPAWAEVYALFDVLSPWSVGRYKSESEVTTDIGQDQRAQQALATGRGQGFMPVVFPGFSWKNLMGIRGQAAPLNQIPRNCGRFFDAQVKQVAANGSRSLYVAMFDELDESTAMLPILSGPDQLPPGVTAVTLGQDGCMLSADFYLKSLNQAAVQLK
jgi:hypothetical protein